MRDRYGRCAYLWADEWVIMAYSVGDDQGQHILSITETKTIKKNIAICNHDCSNVKINGTCIEGAENYKRWSNIFDL